MEDGILIETRDINPDGDKLPFAYYDPESAAMNDDGVDHATIYWVCDVEEDTGRIISEFVNTEVLKYDPDEGKKTFVARDMEAVIEIRDQLISHGWKPVSLPKIKKSIPIPLAKSQHDRTGIRNRLHKKAIEKKKARK